MKCIVTMKNWTNRIDVRLVINKKEYLKGHQNHVTCHRKWSWYVTLNYIKKLKNPASFGMCILNLSIVLMYNFHYDYIKNNYGAAQDYYLLILIVWFTKLKLKMFMKILLWIKTFLILVII